MKLNEFFRALTICLAVVLVFGAAIYGLGLHTDKIISDREAALSAGKEELYSKENAALSTLTSVNEFINKIYKLEDGGYEVVSATTNTYSGGELAISVTVDAEGKISGITVESYPDTPAFNIFEKDPNYIETYKGKDSALADVGVVSGSTISSTAFKTLVADSLEALTSNGLIGAGVKSDEQIFEELIPEKAHGFAKLSPITAEGNITLGWKAGNDTGFALVIKNGDAGYLALVNAMGVCKVYDNTGADVTAGQSTVCDEAKAYAAKSQKSYDDAHQKKLEKLMEGASDISFIKADTFANIVSAATFKVGEESYNAFHLRPNGYDIMDVYVVIDASGAIAKLDVKTMIFEEEYYFDAASTNLTTAEQRSAYKNSFAGLTVDTFTGEDMIIAKATMSTKAVNQAVKDAFEAFETLGGGEVNE